MEEPIEDKLERAEFCFKQSCEQIVFLNQRLWEMKARYNKAQRENHKAFRYSIRLKIAAAEGIRNAYYEYACVKADEVTSLRYEMNNGDSNDDDDEEENDDFDEENDDEEDETNLNLDTVHDNNGEEEEEEDMIVDEGTSR